MSRSYGQYCGLARALNVIGDRWNLLIVRQLLLGPARYRELLEGLPGIATNLLSDRLRDLEAAGVVERQPAADGNAVTYGLTPWGSELRGPIDGLVRWSTPLMVTGPGSDVFRAEWLAVALPALLRGRVAVDASATIGVTVDDETFQISVGAGDVEVRRYDGRDLDATIRAEGMIILGMASGMLDLDDILSTVQIEGHEAAIRAAFGLNAPDARPRRGRRQGS